MDFNQLIEKYRSVSYSERNKGDRFERLIQAYLLTDPQYAYSLKKVWLWNEFPFKKDLGGLDTGIDLVALTVNDEYWAIQCKCYDENATIDKRSVDSFLSTSSREFSDGNQSGIRFSQRYWISTTNKWGPNATEAIKNQNPPVTRVSLSHLQEAPVDWDKLENGIHGEQARNERKTLRPHQKEAMDKAHEYFKTAERGKLIMACGTGKTFNALRIAENETNGNGLVLFLVPSIALLGQSLREWTADAIEPINAICICSDPAVSRKKTKDDDSDSFSVIDLALPASTNIYQIVKQFDEIKKSGKQGLTVVFSTYQSIEAVNFAQKQLLEKGEGIFDLIICDEAHRTTGVKLANQDESAFTKVHNNDYIRGKKRLYMTATPRLYDDNTTSKAAEVGAVLCSMDDESLYGEEIYRIGFGEAVEKGLLTDYKVLILTLNEKDIPPSIQKLIVDKDNDIDTGDASKLIGCINALSKQILGDEGVIKATDPEPMRRAVAFCRTIKESNAITDTYNTATDLYINSLPVQKKQEMVSVSSKHIDGTMGAPQRDELLSWLKSEPVNNECRILTNVRCLSEGVDVPSLDAVLFLSARNSQVDVVQSVGRVMRKSPGKKYGYIIIPVVVPSQIDAVSALDDNERYKVVWTVLNALRAHDDRFNATINKIELNRKKPSQILVGRSEYFFDDNGEPRLVQDDEFEYGVNKEVSRQLALEFEELQHVVFARMVNKVGDRRYWEQWAHDVADIAERQKIRIDTLIQNDKTHKIEFDNFLSGLQKNINPSIQYQQAIDMLSQHIITKPVFEALFEDYSFVKNNPISVSMQSMLDLLEDQSFDKDAETLAKFYDSVRLRAAKIDNAEGKQKIIIELYDKFFKTAFPKMVEQLGIVYTPVECVDFIIHSVNDVLKKEFGRTVSDEGVHILDPFSGTGTFITRLLQSGLIEQKDLERKYKYEIHANEIVLLAYYIAAINIENAYHDATIDPNDGAGTMNYTPFDGIVLTDTFQLGEREASDLSDIKIKGLVTSDMFPKNSERVENQKSSPIKVVWGNPPYSVGQKSANDNAQNQSYPYLDNRISETYARLTSATNKNSLYDSYIKAFRWSSDRLDKNGGVICFISNGAWLDGNSSDGFRKSLETEFSSIYVFNLRGNQRTSGELSRKEGGKIFGSGSRTPISITLLVKNPEVKTEKATIHYHDIGDYLSQTEKLKIIREFGSVSNEKMKWDILSPNEFGDWISLRNDLFATFIELEPDKKFNSKTKSFFVLNSLGVGTSRDSWVYNYSKTKLLSNMERTINFYNEQVLEFKAARLIDNKLKIEDFINSDHKNISWSSSIIPKVEKGTKVEFQRKEIFKAMYRPFCRVNLYFGEHLIHRRGQYDQIFPTTDVSENLIICVQQDAGEKMSPIIVNIIPDLELVHHSQCFPLFYYEKNEVVQKGLFDNDEGQKYVRRDAISDFILDRAKKQYGASNISKEDIFYYVYGFLHSPEYRDTFANDLKKMLPRLPLVDDVKDFWAFSKAGRALTDLHINYESVTAYSDVKVVGDDCHYFAVEKMRFPQKGQKDTIHYNSKIVISNIPEKAYEYVVNGKPAIEWIMERYAITTHKESGITNNPNDWADELGNPRYIFDLLLSIINVSVQTVDIVSSLPKLKFE
jgi:predicted helicase